MNILEQLFKQVFFYKHTYIGKCAAALVMLLMLWCVAGSIAWSGARRLQYVSQQMSRHPDKYKDTIILDNHTAKDITWVEDNEICYCGRMFDIKKTITSGSSTIYIGHYDEKDDKLFKWLHALFDEEQNDDHQNSNLQWKIEATLCFINPHVYSLHTMTDKPGSHYLSLYCSGYLSSFFHPPCTILLV